MKAKLAGKCRLCRTVITPGEDVEKLLGKWVHAACKAAEIARRTEAASDIAIVPMRYTPTPQTTAGNPRRQKRRTYKAGKMR